MKKCFLLFNLIAIAPLLYAQKAKESSNFIAIDTSDTEAKIVRKAARLSPSPRQLRWQKLELTGFLHFGMNTFTDKEWGNGKEDPSLFNPSELNAEQWVEVCKKAGFKQLILTTKHHDGFCLWPSKYTEHSVKNSPWMQGKGDVVKAVADACRKNGIGFGVYLSPWDRNNPDYGDTEKYNTYFMNQLTELLTQYGKVDEVWFDGANGEGPNGKRPQYYYDKWYALIRKLQPSAVIAVMGPDVRWVGTESGYGRKTEWSVIPADENMMKKIADDSQKDIAFAPTGDKMGDDLGGRDKIAKAKGLVWYPAETDVSIRPGWFYHQKEDEEVKTPEKLLDIYYSSIGRNSVLLLNIPPDKRGLISAFDEKNLLDWRALIDKTFEKNFVKDAKLTCKNGVNTLSLKGKTKGHWTTKGKDSTSVIEIELPTAQTVDVLSLMEHIEIGQRIEKFNLAYENDNGKWKELTDGTTVGYKRLLRFDPVTARKFRLTIESSRLNPTLNALGLYKSAEEKK